MTLVIIEVYKHLDIYDKNAAPSRFLISRAKCGHNHQLIWYIPKDGTRGKQTPFYLCTIPELSNLLDETVNSASLSTFKNQLDDAWKDKPWKFNYNYEQE